MRNLLIVDDETNIRMGLKAMIERQFRDRFTVLTAGNGEEALEELARTKVDMVITDIRMPVMDGIELINRLYGTEPRPAMVILSGHDDFAYAKEAIRCEVKEYLLKPIVREELRETLDRLEKELQRAEAQAEKLREAGKQAEVYRESAVNLVLLRQELSPGEVRSRLSEAGLAWMDEGFRIALLKPAEAGRRLSGEEAAGWLGQLADAAGDGGEPRAVLVHDHEGLPLLISPGIPEQVPALPRYAREQSMLAFRVGLSERCRGMEQLKPAYGQARKALKYSFLQTGPGIVAYDYVKDRDRGYAVPLAAVRKLSNMLGTDRVKDMKALLHEIMDPTAIVRYDIAYLEELGRALNELVFDRVFHVYGEESIEILKLYKKVGHMYNFEHFHDYLHGVESLLMRLNEYVSNMKAVHVDHREMKKAVDFIHENYARDLNMAMVANHISLSYSYFSESFKAYTGDSFPHYLKKVRIDNAKRLLETTDRKIYEIGGMVGFENSKHFNRVFKEQEGVTPQEYRVQGRLLRPWAAAEGGE